VLAIIIDFFISNKDISPQALATQFLNQYTFLYPHPENINKDKTFRSPLVQELLATAHLSCTIGHADVPTLNTESLAESDIIRALGLCAASVCQSILPNPGPSMTC